MMTPSVINYSLRIQMNNEKLLILVETLSRVKLEKVLVYLNVIVDPEIKKTTLKKEVVKALINNANQPLNNQRKVSRFMADLLTHTNGLSELRDVLSIETKAVLELDNTSVRSVKLSPTFCHRHSYVPPYKPK